MHAARMMSLTLIHCVALATIGSASAQDKGKEKVARDASQPAAQPATAPTLVALEDALNCKVVIRTAPDSGAAETKGERRANDKREALGVLTDLVIDSQTQRITHAAVQADDGARALPIDHLNYDATQRVWTFAGDKAAMAKASAFDARRLDDLHVARAVGAHGEDASGSSSEQRKEGDGRASTKTADSGRYQLATLYARREVFADDARFAAGIGLILEAQSHTLAFLRAVVADGDIAIPCAALQPPKAGAPHTTPHFTLALSKDKLAKAPRLGKDIDANLRERAFRAKLYEAFGVATPAYDSAGR